MADARGAVRRTRRIVGRHLGDLFIPGVAPPILGGTQEVIIAQQTLHLNFALVAEGKFPVYGFQSAVQPFGPLPSNYPGQPVAPGGGGIFINAEVFNTSPRIVGDSTQGYLRNILFRATSERIALPPCDYILITPVSGGDGSVNKGGINPWTAPGPSLYAGGSIVVDPTNGYTVSGSISGQMGLGLQATLGTQYAVPGTTYYTAYYFDPNNNNAQTFVTDPTDPHRCALYLSDPSNLSADPQIHGFGPFPLLPYSVYDQAVGEQTPWSWDSRTNGNFNGQVLNALVPFVAADASINPLTLVASAYAMRRPKTPSSILLSHDYGTGMVRR